MFRSVKKVHPTVGLTVSDSLYIRNYSDKCKGSDFMKSHITRS